MNLLLDSLFNGLVEYLKMPSMWVALALVIIGASLVILARRIARVIRKTDNIDNRDKYLILFKCLGIVAMFVAVLIIVFINR